jgi:ABC-type thiamin/hydroxymethylpyrimidine transport system permease subunit
MQVVSVAWNCFKTLCALVVPEAGAALLSASVAAYC